MKKNLMLLVAVMFVLVGAFASTAMAQVVRPTMLTYAATEVTKDSAVLNGWVNTNGYDTDVWFNYGSTISLGTQTEGLRVPASQSQRVYSTQLTGLQPATTYYFIAEGSSAYANAYGETLSFTTMPDLSDFNLSVVDSVTSQPFGQAWVYISSVANAEFYWNGWTDVDGKVSLSVPSNALLVVHASDNGGHYGQYYSGSTTWEDARRVSLPASIVMELVPMPIYCYPFNITNEKIGINGGWVQYGIYLENKTAHVKRFTLWATRSFPNKGAVAGSFPYGMKEAIKKIEITLAPGERRKIVRAFSVSSSDPDGYYQVQFYLYNLKGNMINGGYLWFVKGEDNAKG